MQNIGERLEEARKRKGISIREAAEATKIRGDFLVAFESNKFSDVGLPDIYKRGFLKIYADYLEIESDKILSDYTAHQLGNSRLAKKEGREFFGRMDIPGPESRAAPTGHHSDDDAEVSLAAAHSPDAPLTSREQVGSRSVGPRSKGTISTEGRQSTVGDEDSWARNNESGLDRTLYWKIGIIATAVFVLFFLVYALVRAISTPDNPDGPGNVTINPPSETSGSPSTTGTNGSGTTPNRNNGNTVPRQGSSQIILIATGEVFVQVRQTSDRSVLFQGTLSAGDRVPINYQGSADIGFTQGSNLQIEKDGQIFEPDTQRSEYGKINTNNL